MKPFSQYIKKIAPLVIVLVFLAGIVSAVPYAAPTISYPTNVDKPVDVGSTPNNKLGGLSVNAFSAYKDAQFNSETTFLGPLYGKQNGFLSELQFGGYDNSGTTPKTRVANISASGSIHVTDGLYSQETTTTTGTRPLCATTTGKIVFCDATPPAGPVCGNGIVQIGEQCDDGNKISGDGCSATCMDEPKPDLCPDATNPNPIFAGVQNPLPPGVSIVNGLCKVKISADVTYQCISGRVKFTFAFDRPVPEDMMIYVAHLMKGPFNNPPADHLAFTSQYYNFQFPSVTTNNTDNYGTYINLTQGMTSHITPYPKLSNGAQENPFQSSSNVQQCLDAGSLSYARTWAEYFKVGFNSPDIYVTDFRLKNYTGPVPGFNLQNQ